VITIKATDFQIVIGIIDDNMRIRPAVTERVLFVKESLLCFKFQISLLWSGFIPQISAEALLLARESIQLAPNKNVSQS
jgi:hypothetical protein